MTGTVPGCAVSGITLPETQVPLTPHHLSIPCCCLPAHQPCSAQVLLGVIRGLQGKTEGGFGAAPGLPVSSAFGVKRVAFPGCPCPVTRWVPAVAAGLPVSGDGTSWGHALVGRPSRCQQVLLELPSQWQGNTSLPSAQSTPVLHACLVSAT